MKHLKLSLEKAVAAYNAGDSDRKKFLIDLYGEETFLRDIKDRVTGYESACKILGKTPLTLSQFQFLGDKQAKKQFARHKIQVGIEAINEGWVADLDNTNQYKYYIWMYGKSNGFSSNVDYDYFSSSVGTDLSIESRDKAQVIEKVFRQEYIDYLL